MAYSSDLRNRCLQLGSTLTFDLFPKCCPEEPASEEHFFFCLQESYSKEDIPWRSLAQVQTMEDPVGPRQSWPDAVTF